jgi:hypothetical protein
MNSFTQNYQIKILAFCLALTAAILACSLGGDVAQSLQLQESAAGQEEPAQNIPGDVAEQEQPVAQEETEILPGLSGKVLFKDDFQDGDSDGWNIISSWNVQQSGDVYVFGAAGRGAALVPSGLNWSGYMLRADASRQSGTLAFGFDFNRDARYLVHINNDGVFLIKESPPDNFTILGHTGPIPAGEWRQITLGSAGGKIQIWVDQELWIDYSDQEPVTQGTIVIGTLDDSQALVDNVLVAQVSGSLPSSVQINAPAPIVEAEEYEEELQDIAQIIPVEEIEFALAPPQEPPDVQVVEDESPPLVVDDEPPVEVVDDESPSDVQVYPGPGEPDLRVSDISIEPRNPVQGSPVKVHILVQNIGEVDSGAFNVVWMPEGAAKHIGCSWDFLSIKPAMNSGKDCDYQGYPNAGDYKWDLIIDPSNEIDELNEANNFSYGSIHVANLVPLAAPTNCRILEFTSSEVTIGWDALTDPAREGFHIYAAGSNLVTSASSNKRQMRIKGLTPGRAYQFDVRAFKEHMETQPGLCSVEVNLPPLP